MIFTFLNMVDSPFLKAFFSFAIIGVDLIEKHLIWVAMDNITNQVFLLATWQS